MNDASMDGWAHERVIEELRADRDRILAHDRAVTAELKRLGDEIQALGKLGRAFGLWAEITLPHNPTEPGFRVVGPARVIGPHQRWDLAAGESAHFAVRPDVLPEIPDGQYPGGRRARVLVRLDEPLPAEKKE